MSNLNNGDIPAAPLGGADMDLYGTNNACWGLTKREAFAMAAMQGILSNSSTLIDGGRITKTQLINIKEASYVIADEMTSAGDL